MDIKRIDSYKDRRFSHAALMQHGCFTVDGSPYEVEIISNREAIVRGSDPNLFLKIILEFLFYAPHITRFYDENGDILQECAPKKIFKVDLAQIQPSQFYVDREKLLAIRSFIQKPEDVVVQILPYKERYISLDGHTRLYHAVMMGWDTIYGVAEQSDPWIYKFVEEATNRKIYTPMDMELVSHEEYERKWNRFCDTLFAGSDFDEGKN